MFGVGIICGHFETKAYVSVPNECRTLTSQELLVPKKSQHKDHLKNYREIGLSSQVHDFRKQMPFTSPGQITLEKSPAYFVGKLVPERVYKMNPRIKLIVVVRNPITRAISGRLFISGAIF